MASVHESIGGWLIVKNDDAQKREAAMIEDLCFCGIIGVNIDVGNWENTDFCVCYSTNGGSP